MPDHIKSLEFYKGVTIVRVTGSATIDSLAEAQAEYKAKLKNRPVKNILFDLREVGDVDTSSLAALIDLFKYMISHHVGNKIGLINISKKMQDLLAISKTEPLFHEYPSEEEAIKGLE
jgi:Anti-anti-sigma regulatory factor (antagonist of anti-sigma factor)